MSDDLRDQFDLMIEAANRHGRLMQLRDKVKYAIDGGKRECGACQLWMTSKCPQERNVNGRKVGPSMSGYPCSQFARTASDIAIQKGRIEDAIAFATKHGLPVPIIAIAGQA